MTRGERIAVIVVFYIIAFAIFLCSLKGRYEWVPGQQLGQLGDVRLYEPKVFDTWTGKYLVPYLEERK